THGRERTADRNPPDSACLPCGRRPQGRHLAGRLRRLRNSECGGVMDTTESDYYQFMDFDAENARTVLQYYTRFFHAGPVLELASGPGVFLTLLRDAGIQATGVDIDDGMVVESQKAGHDVVSADAIAHLQAVPDESLAGLFAAHFLEHLPSERAQQV